MELAEVFDLARWYQEHGPVTGKKYQALQAALLHNATQAQKVPVRDALENLVSGLRALPMNELNLQQIAHLEKIGIAELLGTQGAAYVEGLVTQSTFDPATSASQIKNSTDRINSAAKIFQGMVNALIAAGFDPTQFDVEVDDGMAMARIHFRQEASIGNISEMKKWSADWSDIVRGLGHLVGETPQDMKVVGATKGSIIVCVVGTLSLVTVLALLSKRVAGIVLDALTVARAIEDLRHKKISNQIVEQSMKADLKAKEAALKTDIIDELKQHAGSTYSAEHDAHLELAVNKFINFSKNGGEVDYLQQPEPEDDASEDDVDGVEGQQGLVSELRELICEIRSIKEQTLLLNHTTEL